MQRFFEKIEYKKLLLLNIIVVSLILIFLIVFIGTYGTDDMYNSFVFLAIFAVAYLIRLYFTKGYQTITITDSKLILEKYFFKRISNKEFLIDKIENLKYVPNEKSDTSFSFVVLDIGGFTTSPDSTKRHLTNPTVINFDYNGESVKIGELTRKFKGESIVRIIKKIQKGN